MSNNLTSDELPKMSDLGARWGTKEQPTGLMEIVCLE